MTWLNDDQQALARIALEYRGAEYAGKIQLTPRESRVVCDSVTNVRVTYRDIQETILLDFRILEAGIRQVSFRLPASMKDADISAYRLRQKTVTPVEGTDYVRVLLELQDAVSDDYRVVIENDRAIVPGRQLAPLPLIDTGTVNNRFVTLENAGRDEIVVDLVPAMESINRQSRQWEQLAARLRGGDFSTAYVTSETGPNVEFGYQTKQRAMILTAGATIGLARTELVMDASGAYRALMSLKVDNRTEPYLEIRLPDNARLWTAHVAQRPVKPARSVGAADDSLLRIPLIKTAEGDLDYPVVLKYAGKVDELTALSPVRFPIIRTENINIELSQVKLYLPEDYRWYQFDGTATRVASEEDFVADYVAYQTQQVEKLTQIIRDSNQFSKSRAISNVGRLDAELKQFRGARGERVANERLRLNFDSNASVLEAATQEIEDLQEQEQEVPDNRKRLNDFFFEQQNTLSRNGATRLGGNFPAAPQTPAPTKPDAAFAKEFDQGWFGRATQNQGVDEANKPQAGAKGVISGKARLLGEESYRVQQQAKMPEEEEAAQQVFQVQPPPQDEALVAQEVQRLRNRALGTKSELNRAYMDKIQELAEKDQEVATGQQAPQESVQALVLADGAVIAAFRDTPDFGAGVQGLAGLSSLDFTLPERGQVFYFTIPRGEVEITARPVSSEMSQRLANFGWLLAIIVVLLAVAAVVRRATRSRTGRVLSVVFLCGAGLMMIVLFVFPLFGLAMFFGGILLALDGRQQQEMAGGEQLGV